MMRPVERLLAKLSHVTPKGNGRWSARCPAHDDRRASLSISETDGRALVHCHAKCPPLNVCRALGLKLADLMPGRNGKSRISTAYDYRDEAGKTLYQVCRMDPKDFRQRKPDGKGGWEWKLGDVRRVLYRLPELLAADPAEPVLIVEGEKDADRLASLGLTVTCNVGGAGKWREEYNEPLRGRDIVIVPDNDDAGRQHAEQIATTLAPVASQVQITTLPGVAPKGDMSDWLGPYRDGDDVRRLIVRRRKRIKATGPTAPQTASITPLADLIGQHPTLREPVIGGLLRRGETMNVIAASKVGKSWLAHGLALCAANGRRWLGRFDVTQIRVLLIDNELHRETLAYRTKKVAEAMGLDVAGIDALPLRGHAASYHELRPLIDRVGRNTYGLIVVDAHYRMLPNGTSENDNAETMRVYNLLDQYAEQTGAAWCLVHHASKGDQSDKQVTDVGAGAGSQSRATDTHLILRRHEQDGCHVMEAAVRSFPPLEPLVLRWEPPLWVPDGELDPERLDNAHSRKRKREDDDKQRALLATLRTGPNSANALARENEMGIPRCQRLLAALMKQGIVEAIAGSKGHNDTTLYRLKDE